MHKPFPQDFAWGVATSAYQIEGAVDEQGRAPSIWDDFSRKAGCVFEGHTGDVACDHYHRAAEDVELMAQLGVSTYRFSVCWPRVLPNGTGTPNELGLAFYDRLIDALLAKNIKPMLTLFHWDFPRALFHKGGWLNEDAPNWFAEYTRLLVDRFSDRVDCWCTLNEPQVFLEMGHHTGEHAPGLKLTLKEVLQATHHALLAHGKAVQTIRARAKKTPIIGWASVVNPRIPATGKPRTSPRPKSVSSMSTPKTSGASPGTPTRCTSGDTPSRASARTPKAPRNHSPATWKPSSSRSTISASTTTPASSPPRDPTGNPWNSSTPPGNPRTAFNWAVVPEALYWGPKAIYERYKTPIIITENGMANLDWRADDGRIRDPQRIDFLPRLPRRARQGRRGGRGCPGLLLLVAHGQLRVGGRIPHALRADLR